MGGGGNTMKQCIEFKEAYGLLGWIDLVQYSY